MKTQVQIRETVNTLYDDALKTLALYEENNSSKVKGIADKSADESNKIVADITDAIETVVKGCITDDGSKFPGFISKYDIKEDETLVVALRSKLKADYKFNRAKEIKLSDNLIEEVSLFIVNALVEMYYVEVANENIKELNDKIAGIIEENEIPYTVKFVVSDTATSIVSSITDTSLVLNASVTEAHKIAEQGLFYSGNEYNDMVAEKAAAQLADDLKAVQTPVQFLKSNSSLIKTVTGVSTKKRANKLIREVCHRKAENLDGVKQGIGYYTGDIDINGETVTVFALVEKAEDGTKSVILSPFDIKTLEKVDVDVLALI